MQKQYIKLDFTGQNIYIGIDTHLKSWHVSILGEHLSHKSFSQPPCSKTLKNYLDKHFPNANYYSVYEAGFAGFSVYRKLTQQGINCIVVNPADVPSKDKEKKGKTDKVDSIKLARSLRSKELDAIYIPSLEAEEERSLLRVRSKLVRDQTRCKNRIKSLIYYYGIDISGTDNWSIKFVQWLEGLQLASPSGNIALKSMLIQLENIKQLIKKLDKEVVVLSMTDKYRQRIKLLRSIPGIGLLTSMIILTELEDIKRFKSLDSLCSYIGLVPNVYNSGDRELVGEMTNRGNRILRTAFIESAWVAARLDPALMRKFNHLARRMEKNKAIVRIARKLVNRVRYVLRTETQYQTSVE
jgi:transposase